MLQGCLGHPWWLGAPLGASPAPHTVTALMCSQAALSKATRAHSNSFQQQEPHKHCAGPEGAGLSSLERAAVRSPELVPSLLGSSAPEAMHVCRVGK